jgi:hypothetical protein
MESALVCLAVGFFLAALPEFGFGDDMQAGFGMLAVAFLVGLLVVWTDAKEVLPRFIKGRATAASIIWLAVVVGMAYGGRWHVLTDMRENVASHLVFRAELESQDNLRSTIVTLRNEGDYDIQYSLTCHIKLLVTTSGGVISESDFRNHLREGVLERGTDAQYDDCLSDLSIPMRALQCADIQVKVDYFLKDQRDLRETKEHGFVTRKIGGRFEWYDRAADQAVSDCQQFVPNRASPEDVLRRQQAAMRVSNREIMKSHSMNPGRFLSASLSEQIFDFAEEREKRKPAEPSADTDFASPQMNEYRKQFSAWLRENSDLYSRFVPTEEDVFRQAQRQGFDVRLLRNTCRFPADLAGVDLIQNCAMSMGILAQRLK